MRIGILSDTHGRTDVLVPALHMLRGRGAEYYIHCGDVGEEKVLDLLAGLPVAFVWGNNDWDVASLEDYAAKLGLNCLGRSGELTLGGKEFAVYHGDNGAVRKRVLEQQKHDYLLSGHTHVFHDQRVARVRLVNPGALYRAHPKTAALIDTENETVEKLIVAP